MVKNLPAIQETRVWSLGQEDPLEKEISTHSSMLAWRIPWTEEPGGLQSMGLQRVGHNWATKHTCTRDITKEAREARGGPKSLMPTSFSGSAPPSFPRMPWTLRNGNKEDYVKCTSLSFPQCDLGCHTVLSGAPGLCCSFRTRTSNVHILQEHTCTHTHRHQQVHRQSHNHKCQHTPTGQGAPEIIIKACPRREAGT